VTTQRASVLRVSPRIRCHGSSKSRGAKFDQGATGADDLCYLATPLIPFGDPGSGVFKYGKTAK
jgi:hypothetical protein